MKQCHYCLAIPWRLPDEADQCTLHDWTVETMRKYLNAQGYSITGQPLKKKSPAPLER